MSSEGTKGWTSGPDGRGTLDILYSCLATISLCCWSAVYPNVPGRKDRSWHSFRDKFGLALLNLLGPEFLLMLAIGQRASARRSVRQARAQECKDWTMEHGFFADMGGFLLKAPDYEEPFPVDAAQTLYLIRRGYIDPPTITKSEIDDRDKSDGLSRIIIVGQACWFTINLIVRFIQDLAVTTLEITTMSFIIILFATSYCWREKPSGVEVAVELRTREGVTIRQILDDAQLGDEYVWYRTPLDFVSRYEDCMSIIWHYYNELTRRALFFSPFSRRVKTKPWDRLPSDMFLKTDLNLELVSTLFIIAFGTIFCAAWNFYFPTTVERYLWHAASIYMIIFTVVGPVLFGFWFYLLLPQRKAAAGLPDTIELDDAEKRLRGFMERTFLSEQQHSLHRRVQGGPEGELVPHQISPKPRTFWSLLGILAAKARNISPEKDPHFETPLSFLIPVTVLCIIYIFSRGYILVEDVIGLRSLPASAFEDVNWSRFVPHI